MDLGLVDRVALVTGASRGIGREVAITLAREGMHVALVARDRKLLEEAGTAIAGMGRRAVVLPCDLRRREAPGECMAACIQQFGRVDLLVNNAGDTKRGGFFELTDDDWALGFELKFFGYMRMARAAWPALRESKGGIVNVIGSNARAGHAGATLGGATNAALVTLTKSLAALGVAENVRVNAINPGMIATDRLLRNRIDQVASQSKVSREVATRLLLDQQRISRLGEPREIAELVAYLASDRAGFVQGAIVDADGGWNRAV